jgi:hypothetical protein
MMINLRSFVDGQIVSMLAKLLTQLGRMTSLAARKV